jgi:hypothetical protein
MGGPGLGRKPGGVNGKSKNTSPMIIKSMAKKGGIAKNMKYVDRKNMTSTMKKGIKASIRMKRQGTTKSKQNKLTKIKVKPENTGRWKRGQSKITRMK